MDGSHRTVIASEDIQRPTALTLDYPVRRLYWADTFLDLVGSMAYDGSDRRKLVILSSMGRPFAIAVFRNNLYFVDKARQAVLIVNKFTGNGSSVLAQGLLQLVDLKVYHVALQPLTYNPCYKNACGCSQLCLIALNRNCSCYCQTGFHLGADKKTCLVLDTFLLIARGTEVTGVTIGDMNAGDAIVPLVGLGHAVGLDYDVIENKVYFSDIIRDNISRTSLSGGPLELVVQSVRNADGLAVDWLGRNLYWTDNDAHELAVSKLNGSFRKALFTDLQRPRAIVVHPLIGYVFW